MENNIQTLKGTSIRYTNSISSIGQGVLETLQLEFNASYGNSEKFDSTEYFSDPNHYIDKRFSEYEISLNEEQKKVLADSWDICPEILDSIIQSIDNIKEQLSNLSVPYQSISINPSLDPEIINHFHIEIEIDMKFNNNSDLVDLWESLNTKCVRFSHPQIALFVNLKSVN